LNFRVMDPQKGFTEIASVTLNDREDNQSFPVTVDKSGRWVRLTVKNNHGDSEYTELMDFRAYGEQLTKTPLPDVSGTYATNYNDFHLRQEGTSVTGCYEYDEGILNGGIEDRIMNLPGWKQVKKDLLLWYLPLTEKSFTAFGGMRVEKIHPVEHGMA